MKRLLLKFAITALRIAYLPFEICRVKNKISFMSRQSDTASEDFRLLAEAIKKEDATIEVIMLTRKITGGNRKTLTYPLHMLRQMYHLATSKVVILDGYCIVACLLPHKPQTKVIQMWHAATAVKKFGYQTIDKPSGSSSMVAEIMQMHKNYDYVLASSKATARFYEEAFRISEEQIQYVGMPHFSELDRFEAEDKMIETYPQLKGKKNIVYIPTFRKGKEVQLGELVKGIDFDEYNLIARLHPLDKISSKDEKVIFDTDFTVYDWMKKADIIIADYSSLIIEAMILNKRMYFFLYDAEEYIDDPGINIDFQKEGLGEFVFKEGHELKKILEKEYNDKLMQVFAKKYVEVNPEESIFQCVQFVIGCMGMK